VSFNILRML